VASLTRLIGLGCLFVLFCQSASPAFADKIDAVKGKRYELTKQHGPWMIMVVSLAERVTQKRDSRVLLRAEGSERIAEHF
jgi:hypothetical protein